MVTEREKPRNLCLWTVPLASAFHPLGRCQPAPLIRDAGLALLPGEHGFTKLAVDERADKRAHHKESNPAGHDIDSQGFWA